MEAAAVPRKGLFASNHLRPSVALLACSDHETADELKCIFEDVACDWRIIRAENGAKAAHEVMKSGLPNLVLIDAELSEIRATDLVEWLRSFRSEPPGTIVIRGSPVTAELREKIARCEIFLVLPSDCPRPILTQRLAAVVNIIEKIQLTVPDVDRIDGLPPAVALQQQRGKSRLRGGTF